MTAIGAMLWCIAAFFATAVPAIAIRRSAVATVIVYALTGTASAVGMAFALAALVGVSEPSGLTLPLGLPWLGAHFRIDALGAFFLIVVNLGGAVASWFALGYGRHETAPHLILPFFGPFLAAMNLVVIADDAFTLLVSWELMSLSSWALVVAYHRDPENVKAGYIYLIMASFGTLALLLAFGLLSGPNGSYGFSAIRAATHSPTIAALVLTLVLVGAGSKAGLVPLHVWLPLAHPAAPSHVSALMSGVMTKVAVYVFIRVVFDLLGQPTSWWGMVVLVIAGATTVLGVLYALMQHDLKRLLAFHTVENIGIVFIGLGLALAFEANAMMLPAAVALTAALFHVFNHSLFKSLLFFGSGAVVSATGERDMEELGGLIRTMPLTAFAFLVGCVAISALPPLNGFVSEWLTFQAVLQSPDLAQWGLKVLVPAVGALLALAAALTAACFVKAFGVSFLGRSRSPAAERAREVDRFSLIAMFTLGALCLGAGIFPGAVIDALSPIVTALTGTILPVQFSAPWTPIVPIAATHSSYNGLLLFLFIAISASLTVLAIHGWASRAVRRTPAWGCGYVDPTPAAQYTASSFAQPIRRVFGPIVFAAREQVTMPAPGDQRTAHFTVVLRDLIWEALYAPIGRSIAFVADQLNHLQFLTIRRYLSLVFVTLVTVLLVLAIWS